MSFAKIFAPFLLLGGIALLINVMKPTEKKGAMAAIGGVLALCIVLLLLAVRELLFVTDRELAFDPLRSTLRVLGITSVVTALLTAWVVVLTHRRNIWSSLLDADESIRLRLRLPPMRRRAFYKSRCFTLLVSVLLGLFILAAVATVAAYFYFKSK